MGGDAARGTVSCVHCQAELPAGAGFCPQCGKRQEVSGEIPSSSRPGSRGIENATTEPIAAVTPSLPPAIVSGLASVREAKITGTEATVPPEGAARPDTVPPPAERNPISRYPRISTHPGRHSQGPQSEGGLLASADPLIGATVADRYRIESMLGRGGMGVVYKVEHSKIGKVMALKLLTGELARDRVTVRRFKREALMVSRLSHPNTVQVFDYGSVGGLTYLAMEYLSGQDLGDLVDSEGPRPFPQMAKIVIQICGALAEAHEKGIVHRDIKPENIFLTRSPSGEDLVKVLDFGLAKLRESKDLNEITSNGNIVGTPYYMPPEQVRGEDVDARGDIYSLCALLYTCITGTRVFEAPTPIAVLTQQLTAQPIPPHERAPELQIPKSVSAIILRGLAKEPSERFQSAKELEEVLRKELQGESYANLHLPHADAYQAPEEHAATRSEVEDYERSLRRRERLAGTFGALALLGLGYLGYSAYERSTRPPEFSGREREPNHEVEKATKVPLGRVVAGRLGKRIAPGRGDQDNYRYTIPPGEGSRTLLSLQLSPLPNLPVCAWIFSHGSSSPLFRYCGGSPGRGIDLPALSLRPGSYLFVVQQDLGKYEEGQERFVYENVSDDYELVVRQIDSAKADYEVEPNDELRYSKGDKRVQELLSLEGTAELEGTLGHMRDADIVCATGSGKAHFVVSDAEGGARPLSAALEVLPLGGPQNKIPRRIHGGRKGFEVTERDQESPYRGAPVDLSEEPCVRLSVVPNPWAPRPHPLVAPGSDHRWKVSLEPVSPEPPEGD